MKKNFKFMLVALLAFFCFNSAMAAVALNEEFEDGNYKFQITKLPGASTPGSVKILGLTDDAKALKNTNGQEPYINNGVLEFPATATYQGGTYNVTEMDANTFNAVAYYATSVTIPQYLTAIPEAAFNTLTNLNKIEFAGGSQVKTIGKQAFASTRITEFDFSKCAELEGLNDEVFVERSTTTPNPNKNSYITKVTVPSGNNPNFKHINGAFRNLTELTEIVGLEDSWIQEIVPSAFAGTKIGTTAAKPLVLPEKDLQYIDQNALKGSNVAYLEIKMGTVLYLGGCNITYDLQNNPAQANYGKYTYTYTVDDASANLYGLTASDNEVAPLVSLTLTGTQKGKICKNAFLACTKLNGLDLHNLFYGTKAQFETSAFEGCLHIEELYINPVSNNETDGYTFEKDAFKNCPVKTLTMVSVNTAKAVNTTAFGESLKNVTIGTVDATGATGAEAFASDAFMFGAWSGATLSLAAGNGEYLNSKDASGTLIANAFNFNNVNNYNDTGTLVYPVVTIGEIKSKGAVFAESALYGPVQKISFVGPIARNGLTVGGDETNGSPVGVKILEESGRTSVFTELVFGENATIETNGIGSGAFAGFTALTSVTFNGLLSENAVATGAFTGSGKVGDDNYIGSKDEPFVIYNVENIANWAVNPFASDAFDSSADAERIIWWSIKDENLSKRILGAIQKAIQGDEYEGTVYDTKYNVYKWVDITMTTPDAPDGLHFLFFQDQSANGNDKIAWGRYDLGKFEKENNKYYVENSDDPEKAAYNSTDMVIPRFQQTTGANVKLTLYGLYYDEDALDKVSTTYLVPLRVVNGTYQIPSDNSHLIIGKAEIQGNGSFSDKDVKIYYNNVTDASGAATAAWSADPTVDNATKVTYSADNTAVWAQLASETRVYQKATAADAKTHQELYDAVVRYQSTGAATDVVTKDLWVMTDPAKYKGFRIDKNKVTKDNYTFIGEGWYYALLNNYDDTSAAARVIWLDEAQATAIFGVKNEGVNSIKVSSDAIYNLQGVRVSNPTKAGIYIQNGKKFVVK